ncbi:MAG: hypothetical protein GYB65_02580 [Chloroflexi bacterium]|nr:hypothetical protein [Chloroflexota bacterium]
MSAIVRIEFRNVNWDTIMRSRRAAGIEFWRDNGNGTCTRLSDGLTLGYRDYDVLPGRHQLVPRRDHDRLS